ncbi:MAG: STT3 domain-containing protein [Nanoarchaeota archaeon]
MSKKSKKTETKTEDAVEIDLGKFNPFKRKKEHPSTEKGDEVTLDFSKTPSFLKNMDYKKGTFIILFLIALVLTGVVRHQAQDLHSTESWAQNAIQSSIRNNIADSVNKQFPNLPSPNKNELVEQQLQTALKDNGNLIEQQTQQVSEHFKASFQGKTPKGTTYTFLGDLDSYYWLRYAQNLVNKGMYCDQIKNGKCWDNYIYAPLGGESDPTLHPYLIASTYYIMNFFSNDVSLLTASYYTVWWGALLCTIVAFFIGRRMVGDYAGFIAGITLSMNALFITRTSGSDNDIWSITLSLLVTWMALEAFEAKTHQKTILFTALAGLFMGVFAFSWQGWWYIFDFILIASLGYAGYLILREAVYHKRLIHYKDADLLHALTFILTFIIVCGIFVTIPLNFSRFVHDPLAPVNFGSIKNAANPSLWPNVYTTVAELNPGSVNELINSGTNTNSANSAKLYFILALLGILLLLVREFDTKTLCFLGGSLVLYLFLVSNKGTGLPIFWYMVLLMLPIFIRLLMLLFHPEKIDLKAAIILIIWFAGTAYATTKGVRFILIFLPAFAVAFGVCLGRIIELLSHSFASDSPKKLLWTRLIFFLIFCLFLITPVQRGWASALSFTPTIDKGWVDSLTQIKEKSAPDAIINSWWDFGHWFKYWGDRRVTLDGATQNHPNAHWLGELMITPNEKESVAILRMLDCGSNNAFESIDKKLQDTEFSHALVHQVILQDKETAHKTLQGKGYTEEEISTILNYTHCTPPEDYFITSEDMVGKAGVWGHFGLWNFTRAYFYTTIRNKPLSEATEVLMKRYSISKEKAEAIYYEVQSIDTEGSANQWISTWPNYLANWRGCSNTTTEVICALNVDVGSQNGQNLVIEKLVVNLSSKKEWDAKLTIGAYANGAKIGEGSGTPTHFIVASDQLKEISLNASNPVNMALIFDTVGGYRVLVLDPTFKESLFTKLFYLDGRYTSHFEKFSDKNTIGGDRILIWKVKW